MKKHPANRLFSRAFALAGALFARGPLAAAAADWDVDPVAWRRDGDAFVGANTGRALAPAAKEPGAEAPGTGPASRGPGDESPCTGPASPTLSERDRYFAEAREAGSAPEDVASKPVVFVREGGVLPEDLASGSFVVFAQDVGENWTLSNALVRLSGRIGGRYLADEIAWGGAPAAGRWGALLQWDDAGAPVWTDVSRVTSVRSLVDETTCIVSITIRAEGGDLADIGDGAPLAADAKNKARFAITHRLSLAPNSDEILVETVSLENTGDAPFTVQALMMRPFAVENRPAEVETVPNLWKGPVEDYWQLSDGSRYGIASTDPGVLKASLWRKDGTTSQHPDVRCMDGKPFALAPGGTWTPSIPMSARIRRLPSSATP